MSDHTLLPHGEDLRRAVRWLSEHHEHDIRAIEEACVRFNLSRWMRSSSSAIAASRHLSPRLARRSWPG